MRQNLPDLYIISFHPQKEHSLANSRTPIYMNQNSILLKRHSRKKREDFIFEEEDFNPNGGNFKFIILQIFHMVQYNIWKFTIDSLRFSFIGYGRWSEWSSCSRSCGAGERTRTRKCQDVTRCHDGDVELKFCFLRKCNVNTMKK